MAEERISDNITPQDIRLTGFQKNVKGVFFIILILLAIATSLFLIEQGQWKIVVVIFGLISIVWCQFKVERWVYICFLIIPLSPSIPIYEVNIPVSAELSDFAIGITILVFLLNWVLSPYRFRKFEIFIGMPFILFLFMVVISAFFAFYKHYQPFLIFNSIGHLIKWACYFGLYFVITSTFKDRKSLINVLRLMLVALSIASIVVIHRYITQGRIEVPVSDRGYVRIAGLIEGVNALGVFLAVGMLSFYTLVQRAESKEIFPRVIFFPIWGLMATALVLTFSRTAWGTFLGGLILASLIRGKRHMAVIFILLSLTAFYLLRTQVEKRVQETFEEHEWSTTKIDLGGREHFWRDSLPLITFRNFLGIGYYNFSQTIAYATPHNQYLALLIETGFPGFFTFMFLLYRIFRYLSFTFIRAKFAFMRELSFGGLIAMIGLLVASIFGEYFSSSYIIGTFISLVAIIRTLEYGDLVTEETQNRVYSFGRPPVYTIAHRIRQGRL